ncbi:hypothetical protein DEJ25_02680 [Curtobacterium sp. MCPF17_011]|uniref:DUF2382 domain-containing protein n=1 Tax=Curtobacterium sp. MCPF17_011 TaxID=2175652 RepID=UPI000DA725C9|nr:DUF2382 domain-containing protein [Curtobacterium sp. MCPF17_011]PZF15632.1 hypothetical protein DEJ25_02680 [Curtobacterium sp. MCPF17_011]
MTHRDQPHASDADDHVEVVRSEERLAVTTERHATERVRLERYIVTEQRTVTVDVSREEVRLTREPITGDTRLPVATGDTVREPIVVVLHEEQLVVSKVVVPVERVTLTTHTVTHDVVVDETLRHEVVHVDEVTGPTA